MNRMSWALLGGTVAAFIYYEWKLKKAVGLITESVSVFNDHIDQDYQELIDFEFEEIIQSYDD
jgi:hypothetical protein